MKSLLFFMFYVSIIFSSSALLAQHHYLPICNDVSQTRSFDTGMTRVWYNLSNHDTIQLKTTITKSVNGRVYYGVPNLKGNGNKNDYYLEYYYEDENKNLFVYDTVRNKEALLIPFDENMVGYQTTNHYFGGEFSSIVLDYHAELITSECVYNDLIMVGIKFPKDLIYKDFTYFKRGVGWVARTLFDELQVYLIAIYIEK